MADENEKPEKQSPPGVVTPPDSTGTPPPSSIPPAGELAGADAEKAAMVEQAKSRVAAVKESLGEKTAAPPSPTAPGTPKAPVKKKEEGPKPVDASEDKLVKKLKAKFDGAVVEACGVSRSAFDWNHARQYQCRVRVSPDRSRRRFQLPVGFDLRALSLEEGSAFRGRLPALLDLPE